MWIENIQTEQNKYIFSLFEGTRRKKKYFAPKAPVITECDFQNNLCGWIDGGSNFHFNRTDGQILTDLGIDGPNVDHTDSKESKLIIFLTFLACF